jgi:hypothetical protein
MQQVIACEPFALLYELRVFMVRTLHMVDPIYARTSQFRWNLPVKLILRHSLRGERLIVMHETGWASKIQDVPFQILVHYLKAARRHPGVMDPQVNEEVFRTVIRICEKVEERFMVDVWRVFVDHDD